MNLKSLIQELYATAGDEIQRPAFRPPASSEEIEHLETVTGGSLPVSLRSFLIESNGVLDNLWIQGQWIENIWLIWPCREMSDNHSSAIKSGVPAEYLAFASAGADGILFLCHLQHDPNGDSPIYVWHPIESTVDVIAPSLAEFLAGWIRGSITV